MAALYPLTLTLMLLVTPIHPADKRVAQYVEVLKDLMYLLKGGNTEATSESILSNGKSGIKNSKKIQSVVSRLMGGLKTLGILPPKNLPSFLTANELDGKRLSGFLYNVSLYLQNSDPKEQGDDGTVVNFLDYDVEENPPPRAILAMRDLFISLRASRNMDSLIELLQNVLNLFTGQQLSFSRQNWEVIITLIEKVFQALLSGRYGHAAAGIQGLVCSITGQSNCGFNTDWLHNLGKFFDSTNWKPVVNFQSGGLASGSTRFRPWIVTPEAVKDGNSNPQSPSPAQSPNTVQNLLQMLSKPNSRRAGSEGGYSVNRTQQTWSEEVLWEGLEELGQNILRKVGTSVYKNFKRKVSRMTGSLVNEVSSVIGIPQSDSDGKCSVGDLKQLLLWGIRNNISWNAPQMGFSSGGFLTGPPFLTCTQPSVTSENTLRNHHKVAKRSTDHGEDTDDALYIEILESVCNESIPGLPGISNFTIYLYCNLLNRSVDAAHPSPDIRATCSDAAWYLSAVEEDFYWVQVCSQFYATEFNSTVCSNVSLLSQRVVKQPWILQLCARLHTKSREGSASLSKCDTFAEISNLNLEVVQKCILPNTTEYLQSLCSNGIFLKSIVGNKTLIVLLCNQLGALMKEVSSVFADNKSDEDYLNSLCSKSSLLKSMGGNQTWIDHLCKWLSNRSKANVNTSSKCDMLFAMPDPNLQVVEECILYLGVGYVKDLCLNSTSLKNSTKNRGWIHLLCTQMTSSPKPPNKCNGSEVLDITLEELQECIFQNGATILWSLCSSETLMKSEERGKAWIIDVCNQLEEVKRELGSIYGRKPQLCNYKTWSYIMFTNATLLEICKGWDDEGLKETICWNTTLLLSVSQTHPWVLSYCSGFDKPQEEKCFLQHLLDMLPIPFNFNTTQLCSNPTSFVIELLDRFSRCDDEAFGWILNANYILRVLEFVVDFSGLDQSGKEVQQELSEAILLSNLLDNTSFWASFQPNASVSILQAVDTYLKKEKNPALKTDLLSCFSPVLWDLLQTEDSPSLRVLFQEYLQMPQETFRKLVMSAESETVKKFLSHMHRTWHQMQVSQTDELALETLTASFLHKFPRVTPDLFVDLSQFIPFMTSSDIMSFPVSLLLNDSVLAAIRDHSSEMKPTQKKAFAKRLLNTNTFGDVSSWPPYFLRSVQPLLPYLPLCHFQQLSAQQLMSVIDLFRNTSLDPSRGRHLIRTVLSTKRNIPSDEITRLGRLICFANYEQLRFFLSAQPYSEIVSSALLDCLNNGAINPYGGAAHILAAHLRRVNVSSLNNWNLLSLGPLLPVLGVRFLEDLPEGPRSRLVSSLGSVKFPPAQARQFVTEILHGKIVNVDTLCQLGYLLSGVSPNVLRTIPGPVLARACVCLTPYLTYLSSAQKAAILEVLRLKISMTQLERKIQSLLESWPTIRRMKIVNNFSSFLWDLGMKDVPPFFGFTSLGQDPGRPLMHFNCLNPFVPLKDLSLDLEVVLGNLSLFRDWKWSRQQAQFIFRKIRKPSNMTQEFFLSLGNIAGGADCETLQRYSDNSAYPDFMAIVGFLREFYGGIQKPLLKCILEEIVQRLNFFDDEVLLMMPELAADLPLKILENLSNESMRLILAHLTKHPERFLQLPSYKRTLLAEKVLQLLDVASVGEISGEVLDNMGPILTYVDENTIKQISQPEFLLRLDDVKCYCFPEENRNSFGRMLIENNVLGDASFWTLQQMEHVDRLVFMLPAQSIHQIPKDVLTLEMVEMVLRSQGEWDRSDIGGLCQSQQSSQARTVLLSKKQSLTSKAVKSIVKGRREPVPKCEDIKVTFPAAWSSGQLAAMEENEFTDCLEIVTWDKDLSVEQLKVMLSRAKQVYGPVKTMEPCNILALGRAVTQLSDKDLQDLDLSDLGILSFLGEMEGWNLKQRKSAISSALRWSQRSVSDLDSTTLTALGHLICGMTPSEIRRVNPEVFSEAVLFVGKLRLRCSEAQLQALATLTTQPQAFGPVSQWGAEIFTEIGSISAGLPDIVLSSLVKYQIEGLSATAISLMGPGKFSVVFSPGQLSCFTSDQAAAVTLEQYNQLDTEQRQAINAAQYEGDGTQESRGRNNAASTSVELLVLFICLFVASWKL